MLLGIAAVLALLTALVTGGRLAALADLQLRRSYLVAIALGAQIIVVSIVPGSFDGLHEPVHLATYVVLAAFLWSNRQIVGLPLVAAGAATNAAAIFANDGVMPASPSALATAGMPADKAGEFANSAVVDHAQLSWLGDIFAVPASWPLSNVFSVGDGLIALGVAVALHGVSESRAAAGATALRRRIAAIAAGR
jgi:hypothetical protein